MANGHPIDAFRLSLSAALLCGLRLSLRGHQGSPLSLLPSVRTSILITFSCWTVEFRPLPVDLPFSSFPSCPQLVKPFFLGQGTDTSCSLRLSFPEIAHGCPSCRTAVPRHAVRSSFHACRLHMICSTCPYSGFKVPGYL